MGDRRFGSEDLIRIFQRYLDNEEQAEVLDFFIDEFSLFKKDGSVDPTGFANLRHILFEFFERSAQTVSPRVTGPEIDAELPPGTVQRRAFDAFVRAGGAGLAPQSARIKFISRAGTVLGRRQRAEEETD